MAQEKINATLRQTNLPNESDKYLSKREELRIAEVELMRQRERVAELRRQLPEGAIVQDYVFEEGPANLDVAIVAAADPAALRAHARERGWDRLRLLSCGANTFKYDLGSEDREGHQDSTISVFTRDTDGTPRHFYSVHPSLSSDIKERGIDLLCPVWHILDLTPQGRGEWYADLGYGTNVSAARR